MKKIIYSIVIVVSSFSSAGQVGIGTSVVDESAALEIFSSTKGFLLPRMTQEQIEAISSPALGLKVFCTDTLLRGFYYYDGADFVHVTSGMSFAELEVLYAKTVTSSTGQVWMDRNLGATQVATSSTDYLAYGDLYQWGRVTDGHQLIIWTSSTTSDGTEQNFETTTIARSETPGHENFILGSTNVWMSIQKDGLWNLGTEEVPLKGINDPCPTGFRVPTETEWNAERSSNGGPISGAFTSVLKLPLPGYREEVSGTLTSLNSYGIYWTSKIKSPHARSMRLYGDNISIGTSGRSRGSSVRCIQE
ncbi:fibrobacter succinogenes major paralogous domain-containing protein [Polaribacter sp.]|nr:fibrobacter succinogenes major paralogous domain-containing protein [Polaribacter sp.]